MGRPFKLGQMDETADVAERWVKFPFFLFSYPLDLKFCRVPSFYSFRVDDCGVMSLRRDLAVKLVHQLSELDHGRRLSAGLFELKRHPHNLPLPPHIASTARGLASPQTTYPEG